MLYQEDQILNKLTFGERQIHDSEFKENFILIINPQGCVGNKALKYMNYPGTTCFGGQISFVMNLADSFAKLRNSNDVPVYEVRIISQKVEENFQNDFAEESELNNNYYVDRIHLNNDMTNYIDKEALIFSINDYYCHLQNWGIASAKVYLKLNKVPAHIILNYWDSYVSVTHMIDYWKKNDTFYCPKIIAIPHSLGYRKLVSTLISKVKPIIKENPKREIAEIVNICLKELMDDQKVLYPQRILTERLMFSNEHIVGSVNSQCEKDQILAGPYVIPFKDYRPAKKEFIFVSYPGIDSIRFGDDNSEMMEPHQENAKSKYEERLRIDISEQRTNLSVILAVGRLHYDKNFHSLAIAFKENKQLSDKANLVFVVNGPSDEKNENYILNMQKAIKNGQKTLNGFSGSSLEQLINLAKILDCEELEGKWTAVSLPDGLDYAGLQRYLGKIGNTVSGLFSLKEPYGLSPWESVCCGIPVVVSQNSGVAEELTESGAYSFNPIKSEEIATALLNTFNNFDEVKISLMEASKKKHWCETAKKLLSYLDNKKNIPIFSSKISSINVNEPSFIKDGKALIFKTISKELKDAKKGELREIFDFVEK